MKNVMYSTGIFFIFILKIVLLETEKTPNSLTYKVIKDSNTMKVHLILNGGDYTSSNHCYVKKSNDNNDNFEDIDPCVNPGQTDGANNCAIICNKSDHKLGYDKFSPRTKYIGVYFAKTSAEAVKKSTGATVFGFDIPLLVNPQVTITTNDQKLKLSTITCKKVACPIYYKDVQYANGAVGSTCAAGNNNNEVEFDVMIPHYEMKCENYPSFFYKLQNKYTLLKTDVYIPQYYVKFNNTLKNKYLLKFTNKFPFEICRFSIREVLTQSSNDYTSNCGGTGKECYAPCDNVELNFKASKSVVEILIQSRHFPLKNEDGTYSGYIQKKFVISEAIDVNGAGELLSAHSATGVTLKVKLFNPDTSPKFSSCTVSYYAADKPPPVPTTANTRATCASQDSPCVETCAEPLIISRLAGGKPYILEIAASTTETANNVPNDFKEHIFFRTNGSTFPDVTPIIKDTSFTIQALTDKGAIANTDVTCAYYISPRGKDVYVCAMCVDSYPCRGYCKEPQHIVGLTPGTEYDLKVVAHDKYGFKVHQVTTGMSTLTLEHQFLDRGFKVIGSLTSPYPGAVCQYKIKLKKGETFDMLYECPAPTKAGRTGNSVLEPTLSKIGVARSADKQSTDVKPPATNVKIPPCQTLPLCSGIIFSEGYEAEKEYQVLVTAVGRSIETTINIPKNPLPTASNDPKKQIIIVITRDKKTLNVKTTLPLGVDENSLCKWKLTNSEDSANPIVKKCMVVGEGCTKFPPCKEFTIDEVMDTNNYHLAVFHSEDASILGIGEINRGETSNKSVIIAVVVPVAIAVIGIGVYFGYSKNRN